MGFTTGFLGGITLTYSLLYLSLYLHRTNRAYQHTLLSQQSALLTSLLEPIPSSTGIPPATLDAEAGWQSRKQAESLPEVLKERWNAEVEGMVRRVQETDWRAVRERWERRGMGTWRNLVKD